MIITAETHEHRNIRSGVALTFSFEKHMYIGNQIILSSALIPSKGLTSDK